MDIFNARNILRDMAEASFAPKERLVDRLKQEYADYRLSGFPFSKEEMEKTPILSQPITKQFTSRTENCLRSVGIETIGQILETPREEIERIPGLGSVGVQGMRSKLISFGYDLKYKKSEKIVSGVALGKVSLNGTIALDIELTNNDGEKQIIGGYISALGLNTGTKVKVTLEILKKD